MFLPLFPLKKLTIYGLDESDLGAEAAAVAESLGVAAAARPGAEAEHLHPQRPVQLHPPRHSGAGVQGRLRQGLARGADPEEVADRALPCAVGRPRAAGGQAGRRPVRRAGGASCWSASPTATSARAGRIRRSSSGSRSRVGSAHRPKPSPSVRAVAWALPTGPSLRGGRSPPYEVQIASLFDVNRNSRARIAGTIIGKNPLRRPDGDARRFEVLEQVDRAVVEPEVVDGVDDLPFSTSQTPSRVSPVTVASRGLTARMYQNRVTSKAFSVSAMNSSSDLPAPFHDQAARKRQRARPVFWAQ